MAQLRFFVVLFLLLTTVQAQDVTRFGAKITKSELAETATPTLGLPEGWKLVEGDAFTGLNRREYYFTIEAEGKDRPAPMVSVSWPNVQIAKVYGVTQAQISGSDATFRMNAGRTPTHFSGTLPHFGAVEVCVFHNVPGVQAGPYRGLPYPERQIQAHLNFMFASLEMMREMGFTDSADAVKGQINIYGFETNFPNGHVDFPPHFHIMVMWNGWRDNRVCHFILDENGKILRNDHFVVKNNQRDDKESVTMKLGSSIPMEDETGKVRFALRMLEDGSGLEMTVPGQEKQAKIQSDDPIKSVSVYVRENSQAEWKKIDEISVNDDSINGVLTVTHEKKTDVWNYDPNTGALR
ncbi:MAG: hypothetical protein IJU53_10315 [Thermoguttaceae bacterium]|nr:hypothetical protein [Thermoguttaceae bacterium]